MTLTPQGITQELADFAVNVKFDDLPEGVVQKTKRILLDSAGCALGGYIVDRGKIAIEFIEDQGGNPQATVIGWRKAPCTLAAFANGELINALDWDAHGPITAHTVPYVLPGCLATGERARASGKELITALAVAMEIAGRVGASMSQRRVLKEQPPYWEDSPRSSYTTVIFGAAAGAGKMLRLSSKQMANALGIAGASTPVPAMRKWDSTPPPNHMVKYNTWAGWISQLATVAALAADRGFTGDTSILDGDMGFWKIYGSPFFKEESIRAGLGKVWHIEEVSLKAFPCCGSYQTATSLIPRMMREHGLKSEEIEGIVVKGDPVMKNPNRTFNGEIGWSDSQFVSIYLFALAPFYGTKPSPLWQSPAVLNDPRVRALMKNVTIEEHPQASEFISSRAKQGRMPTFHNIVVELKARGQKFTDEVTTEKFLPTGLTTDEQIKEKFRSNAAHSVLRSDKAEAAIEMALKLETVEDVTEFTRLLTIE